MPSLAEALRALEGSLAIARQDPDASRFFDLSADSFWRSFGAVIYLAPLYLIFTIAEARMAAEIGDPSVAVIPGTSALLTAEMITMLLEWFAYPIAIFFLAPQFGLGQRVSTYIIVYNWSSLGIAIVMLPNFLLYLVGFFPIQMAILVNLGVVLAVLWYRWHIAREVLGAPAVTAFGFVALDVVLGLFIGLSIASVIIGQA